SARPPLPKSQATLLSKFPPSVSQADELLTALVSQGGDFEAACRAVSGWSDAMLELVAEVARGPMSEAPVEEVWHWLAGAERLARGLSFAEHFSVQGLVARLEAAHTVELERHAGGGWQAVSKDSQQFVPRTKALADTRPSDFRSFKQIPGRPDLIRLIVGRLMTSDGQDIHDDYTVAIEKSLWRKPLDWIMRSTYCKARGVREDEVMVKVKFLLPQAGAGLGWLDTSLTPLGLKLKDSDIVEVLVASKSEDVVEDESMTRAQALQVLSNTSELPQVWAALARFAEDDLVVAPGLELLADKVEKQPALCRSVFSIRGNSCDVMRLLSRLLGDLHSGNGRVQRAGWRLLTQAAKDSELRPVARRAKAIALRLQRDGGDPALPRFLELVGYKAPTRQGELVLASTRVLTAEDFVESALERWRTAAAAAAVKLERAVHQEDPMEIEKALHNLILKMQRRDVDWPSVQDTGVGVILRQLSDFHGDGDIQLLARKAVLEAAKLQHANLH
ncbi:unnamed protein product, partial [Effrenium voratum]